MPIKHIVKQGQSIQDVTIQRCGSVEYWIEVALLNNCSITDDKAPGQELLLPDVKSNVARYFELKKITPATK